MTRHAIENFIRQALWTALAYAALLTAIVNWRYVSFDLEVFHPIFRYKYATFLPVVVVHGATGIFALALGCWQFGPTLPGRRRNLHRWIGKAYMVCVAIGGVTGFYMALHAHGGASGQAALTTLAILWLYTGWKGLATVRARRFEEHRVWMIRNYALTFAAVALRFYVHAAEWWLPWEYDTIYKIATWGSWLPQLLTVEFILEWRRRVRLQRRASTSLTASPLPDGAPATSA
jgi:uncharacterized membrane protein